MNREQTLIQATQAISSNLDAPSLLQLLVRLAAELAGGDFSWLELLNQSGDQFANLYAHNKPNDLVLPGYERGFGVSWEAIDSNRAILIHDYDKDLRAVPELANVGIHEFLCVPVTANDIHLGVLSVVKLEQNEEFSPLDLSLVEAIGRLAGMSILNFRLSEKAQKHAQEAETLRQAGAAIISELDLDHVLDRILVQLQKVIQYDSAALYLLDEDSLRIVAAKGFPNTQNILGKILSAENPLFKESLVTGRPTILSDAVSEINFEQLSKKSLIRGWIGVPLHIRGRVIGFLTIGSHLVNAYGETEATQTQAFANQATIALENARLFKELQSLATTDSLTGLLNRRHFISLAKIEFQRARRFHQPLSLILFDIDDFKSINDVYGHVAGDQVLQGLAEICSKNLRKIDLLGRYGGEEYMALLPNTPVNVAESVAERLRNLISITPIETDREQIYISASFGVAELDDACPDLDTLLKKADRAAYTSKFDGKNRVSISEDITRL